MRLGEHLHELSSLRAATVLCALLALLAALAVSFHVSIAPPKLGARVPAAGSATVEVLVDTPRSTVYDLRQPAVSVEDLTNRAVLLGNLIAGREVLAFVAKRTGLPPQSIRASSPTPLVGRAAAGRDQEHSLTIQANPIVPILSIEARAPSAGSARQLADGAVAGLRDYLTTAAEREGTVPGARLRVEQLGRASATVAGTGPRPLASVAAFVVVFALSSVLAVALARMRRALRGTGSAATQPDHVVTN